MARTGRPKGATAAGTGRQVRLNAEIYRKAKLVLSQHPDPKKLSDYISELVAPAVDRDYARALKKLEGSAD